MPHVRLEHQWRSSAKILKAWARVGDAGPLMWAMAISWCSENLTNGRIPFEVISTFTRHKQPRQVLDCLVAVGAVHALGDDEYEMHNFLKYNPSKTQVETRKAERQVAGSKGGRASAVSKQTSSNSLSNSSSHSLGSATDMLYPSPSPSPTTSTTTEEREISPPVAAPVRRSRKAPTPTEAHPRHGEVVDAYFAAFEAVRGTKPTFGAREGRAVRELLSKLDNDADRVIALVRDVFAPTSWWATRSVSIVALASDPSKYLGAATTPRKGPHGHEVQTKLAAHEDAAIKARTNDNWTAPPDDGRAF